MKLYITESNKRLQVSTTSRMTAAEAETLLDGVFEPVLGNPDADGYVLSSTAAGVRSWVEGGGDVDDLTTTTGSSTDMLRVAAAGGLEYRTAAQVLADIGAAPTASPTFSGTVTAPTIVGGVIKPASDSTTALQLANAAGTAVLTVDTTNKILDFAGYAKFGANGRIRIAQTYSNSIESTTDLHLLPAAGNHVYVNFERGKNVYIFAGGSTVLMTADAATMSVGIGTTSPSAFLHLPAATTGRASLRIPSGTAPTTPNAGDIWFDGTNLKMYDGTTTRTISWT